MKHQAILLTGIFIFLSNLTAFTQNQYWNNIRETEIPETGKRLIIPQKYQTYDLDLEALQKVTNHAPLRFSQEAENSKTILEIPTPDGELKRYNILNAPVFAPELAAKYPEIKSFSGLGIDDPHAYIRFDLGPKGFHAMILSPNHSTIFVDPYHDSTLDHYIVYYKKDFKAFLLKNYSAQIINFAAEHTMRSTYEVRIDLFFPIEQLVNKGWPKTKTYFKKMDVGNRRKLLEDCLSESLGIDDMYTFDLRMVKQATAEDPYLTIKITRTNEEDYGL